MKETVPSTDGHYFCAHSLGCIRQRTLKPREAAKIEAYAIALQKKLKIRATTVTLPSYGQDDMAEFRLMTHSQYETTSLGYCIGQRIEYLEWNAHPAPNVHGRPSCRLITRKSRIMEVLARSRLLGCGSGVTPILEDALSRIGFDQNQHLISALVFKTCRFRMAWPL